MGMSYLQSKACIGKKVGLSVVVLVYMGLTRGEI